MITTLRMNKGRVTIPFEIRKELGIGDDDLVELEIKKPKSQEEGEKNEKKNERMTDRLECGHLRVW